LFNSGYYNSEKVVKRLNYKKRFLDIKNEVIFRYSFFFYGIDIWDIAQEQILKM